MFLPGKLLDGRLRAFFSLWLLVVTVGPPPSQLLAQDLVVGPGHRVLNAHLSPEALRAQQVDGFFALPQLRAYDSEGRQIFDGGLGYDEGIFLITLSAALAQPTPTAAELTLADEIARLEYASGDPLPEQRLAGFDFVLIKYEADWCAPCHAQSRALSQLLPQFANHRILIAAVDTEPSEVVPTPRN